ncbi:unnamed protein product [Periconia digitata]|uniref:CFEM domain-containing protein n=1 Tax=Periconia digitata TaxID=1303443 RepID=A0A9W4XSS4_9PLEO|nr:unnamed protein product [Periconia digitata]
MQKTRFLAFAVVLISYTISPVLGQLPPCAQTCFETALQNQNECTPDNIPCICTSPSVNAAIQGCVGTTCTVREALVAVNGTSTMCGAPTRDKSDVLLNAAIASGVVAFVAVTMRMSVAFMARSFRWDDACALAAWLTSIPLTVLQFITPGLGLGRDTWTLAPTNITKILKLIFISQAGYFICIGFTKLTFLSFFLYIFPSEGVRKIVFILMGITVCHSLGFELALIFGCKPIHATWTGWMKEEPIDYCMNQNAFIYAGAGTNLAIDLAVLVTPITQLVKLKLSLRRKLFLISIFSVGALTMVISCIRIGSIATYGNSANPTFDSLEAAVYSVVEQNVGVICICMPMFRRFLSSIAPKCFGSSHDESDYKYHNDDTPNARIPDRKSSSNKPKKATLSDSLFQSHITKTTDTRVTSEQMEDEVCLVELQQARVKDAPVGTNHAVM